jgi:hypothetical protein
MILAGIAMLVSIAPSAYGLRLRATMRPTRIFNVRAQPALTWISSRLRAGRALERRRQVRAQILERLDPD